MGLEVALEKLRFRSRAALENSLAAYEPMHRVAIWHNKEAMTMLKRMKDWIAYYREAYVREEERMKSASKLGLDLRLDPKPPGLCLKVEKMSDDKPKRKRKPEEWELY